MFVTGLENGVDRLLDAEIQHPVAVVGQDDVDEVFADVVHIALHSRQHDPTLARSFNFLHVLFEVSDRCLHRLGALQHERQLHLPGTEQLTDDPHAGQQVFVDDRHSGFAFSHRLLEIVRETFRLAIDDAALQAFGDR